MYDINFGNMSVLLNETKSAAAAANGAKVDCAKECPCGVPAIPVPDQWLEVMVTGGFKVWHIIFIIIAFVVTLVVVYCCFHRCRIPRTKQEIEADLMRTTLTTKFRDYLQEFPNEPTTFVEALKRVQELEEKALENEDSGARKRMGWLKLKGKDKVDKEDPTAAAATASTTGAPDESAAKAGDELGGVATRGAADPEAAPNKVHAGLFGSKTDKQSMFAAKLKEQAKLQMDSINVDEDSGGGCTAVKQADEVGALNAKASKQKSDEKPSSAQESATGEPKVELASSKELMPKKEKEGKVRKRSAEKKVAKTNQHHDEKARQNLIGTDERVPSHSKGSEKKRDKSGPPSHEGASAAETHKERLESSTTQTTRTSRPRKKRTDKPGLTRTKATHAKLRSDSVDTKHHQGAQHPTSTQLELPSVSQHHHHGVRSHHHQDQQEKHVHVQTPPLDASKQPPKQEKARGRSHTSKSRETTTKTRSKTREKSAEKQPGATVIQIPPEER